MHTHTIIIIIIIIIINTLVGEVSGGDDMYPPPLI